jgi:XTP/dITP diphosphohydrolase
MSAFEVVVASRNRHKLREIGVLLREIGVLLGDRRWALVSMDDVAPDLALVEDEPTFEGNALAKARQAAKATGLPAIADDSGLEVDALGGAPGVRSARYAGEPCEDGRNNVKLLAAMAGVPADRRTARYRCAAAFVHAGPGVEIARAGACEGVIVQTPRGSGGFGYDPLFLLPGLGQTMAQIDLATKNALSHRAAAFRALAVAMQALLSPGDIEVL